MTKLHTFPSNFCLYNGHHTLSYENLEEKSKVATGCHFYCILLKMILLKLILVYPLKFGFVQYDGQQLVVMKH